MKQITVSEILHDNANDLAQGLIGTIPEIKIVTKIDEALHQRGLTKAKLAKLTGLRPATITDLAKGERQMISKSHIALIMIALRITDIREIIDIQFDPETTDKFTKQAIEWKETREAPEDIRQIYKQNVMS